MLNSDHVPLVLVLVLVLVLAIIHDGYTIFICVFQQLGMGVLEIAAEFGRYV